MKLDGALALRQSWCAPDEPILLCAPVGTTNTGFDVDGLDWWGEPRRGIGGKALRALGTAAAAVTAGGPRDQAQSPPKAVVFGPGPDAIAVAPGLAVRERSFAWWVLTPRRMAWVRTDPEPPAGEAQPDKSVLDQVLGFAKSARDAFAGKDRFPAHVPVETADVVPVVEVPRKRITGVAVAQRKLPYDYTPGTVHVLRVSLVDGSGVDVVGGHEPAHAHRLLALVNGR
ncbi:hypothetical protein LZG04_30430 [Saccharothrix sp. S26]|uniref:hypothetical protein n=1 Tax=Saccharothrix sp. S26 TaxID=2907215 RepID=UPI001F1648C9|nr:hypothetical protein [Saccharothrix sp. S26]MCE6999089.1 hypothetical protein [Saccharothrix sp. S26]